LAIGLVKSESVSAARLAAFEILSRVEDGAFASILLAAKEPELSTPDRALTHELVLGVLRNQLWLDSLIEQFADRKLTSLDPAVRSSLRLGLYQLRFLSRIPDSAAVNESVKLIRRARLRSAEGFVNAVLRRATREPDYDPVAGIADRVAQLSIETSHPRWLLDRWVSAFGFEHASAFAHANNEVPPLAFRIIRTRSSEREIRELLESQNIEKSKIAAGGFRASSSSAAIFKLAEEGKIYIQDEASQLVANILRVAPGESFLDVCAAPGSKTTQVADLASDQAEVIAGDLYPARLRMIEQTASLHGLTSIRTIELDGLQPLPFPENRFDAVLVDAPCSGTGTLRRNPEIRWRISAADIEQLSERQKQLLANAATVLKPQGRLVYSTCSVEPEENEEVVAAFLENNPEFQPVQVPETEMLTRSLNGIRTWPYKGGADGFYISVLERTSNATKSKGPLGF
jgi:16S rRNA (cytosine967-C5)-methyltransferase